MCLSSHTYRPQPISIASSIKDEASFSAFKKTKHKHVVVQHHYHDHAYDEVPNYVNSSLLEVAVSRNGSTAAFPLKLFDMLTRIEQDGFSDVVSWQPHGRCFIVHKPEAFKELLPRYFKLSKIASFQRQLNLYGFKRLTKGMDRGGYYHELFLRGKAWLAHKIQRVKVKGTFVRGKSNPEQEPDLWDMAWVTDSESDSSSSSSDTDESSVSSGVAASRLSTDMNPLPLDTSQDIIVEWGLPFHRLDDLFESPVKPEPAPLSTFDEVDLLEDIDFEQLVRVLDEEDADERAFADLLEMVIA